MHIPDRSPILDELAKQSATDAEQPIRYNIRHLSREIMQRTGGDSYSWINEQQSHITLETTQTGDSNSYELLVREVHDSETHRYVYHSARAGILHAYPMLEWRHDEKSQELRGPVEQILLSGPVPDKVPDVAIENKIQTAFAQIGRRVLIENVAENLPGVKEEVYRRYLATSDPDVRKTIIDELYDKASTIGTFIINRAEFDYAFISDLNDFRITQKQLASKPTTSES